MIRGNKFFIYIFILIIYKFLSRLRKIITTSPLINLIKIKPSFEEIEIKMRKNFKTNKKLKEKKNNLINLKSSQAILIGLDKITAKSSELIINLNETKKFGSLEIKILKCGKVK